MPMTPEGAEHLSRLAVAGMLVELRPIRRQYGRDLLGWIGIIVAATGTVALIELLFWEWR